MSLLDGSVTAPEGEVMETLGSHHHHVVHASRSAWRRQQYLVNLARLAAVLIIVFITFIPVLWILLTGFKSEAEYLASPPVWIPSSPSWANYVDMWNDGGFEALVNSLIVTIGGCLIAMVGGVPAAYSLSRFRTGGQNLANWILSIKFMPPIAFAIPIAVMFQTLRLIDTYLGLILVYGAFNLPFVVWTMKGFIDEIPRELDESAMIDGCSRLGALWRIALPLSSPGLVTTILMTFIFIWSEFLFALILSQTELFTVPVRLSQYYSEAVGLKWGPQAALATVAILPMIAIAFIGQRYIIRALTFGAVKD
ncbi:MAG: carbohydrate ABC transporter permease [Anaerolineae bacterium]